MALASSPVMLFLLPPTRNLVYSSHFTDISKSKMPFLAGLHVFLLTLTFTFMFECDTVDINYAKFQVNPC